MKNRGSVWVYKFGFTGLCAAIFALAAACGAFSIMVFQLYFGDDTLLQKSTFLARMNEETIILTNDEETRIGSFFDSVHRRFIPIEEVPVHLINAFIASEDKNFYSHIGVDPPAIVLAFLDGLRAGSFRRGASTITQQTVKNILDHRDHSFRRKFQEWVRALQLERLYDKMQIMEFYLNQFHVAHNGNGVGIAARYYFDKDVRDLNLTEAAFIAGSVKAPSKYNPFIKNTPERRNQAWEFANERKNYVLKRMWEQGLVNKDELEDAWNQQVPFNKGKFQSKEVALVSLIRSQVNRKEILDAIGLRDLSELNTAGLKIYTTLDIEYQRTAQLAMRRNLSRLESILKGFEPEKPERFRPERDLDINEFYFCKVIEIKGSPNRPEIRVDFGLSKGTIPYESVMRYAKILDVAQPIGLERRIKELVAAIKVDDVLFVEVREYDRNKHEAIVEFQKHPEISGGLIAIDKGEVRAVVSGFYPEGYNRAIFATRQPGSVFKSVVYYAALQLGWSMLDPLDNSRRVFPYQGQFYYPQPDHDSPFSDVSMMWAGIKSENLASVYLTAHLLDRLDFEQFKGVMALLGLLPIDNELPRDYHYRVAKTIGVQMDHQGVREYELHHAIEEVAPDLIFRREEDQLQELRRMWWGRGYKEELQVLYALEPEDYSDREQMVRVDLVRNNLERHRLLKAAAQEDWQRIEYFVSDYGTDRSFSDPEIRELLGRFRVSSGRGGRPQLLYFKVLDGEQPGEGALRSIDLSPNMGRQLSPLDVQSIWGGSTGFAAQADISLGDVRLEGILSVSVLDEIEMHLRDRIARVMSVEDPYDLIRYFHHHDMRIAIGLNYLTRMAQQMGVFSPLEPVLSFPLGTNVVSVAEVAKVYQTFVDGKIYRFYKEGPTNQLNFIKRIEDRFGNVLFQPEKIEHQLVAEGFSLQMRQILRKVVTHGTGRLARGELFVEVDSDAPARGKSKKDKVRIPSYGKTGTTNDYRTASFAGFIPYPVAKGAPLDPRNVNVLASYVGYDMNDQMRRGGYKVGGATGALPAWVDLAKGIITTEDYAEKLDRFDINVMSQQEWPLLFPQDSQALKVDLARGLLLRRADSQDFEQFPTTDRYTTGELDINEFAIDASVQSVVRVPGGASLEEPLHQVGYYNPMLADEELEVLRKLGALGGGTQPAGGLENARGSGSPSSVPLGNQPRGSEARQPGSRPAANPAEERVPQRGQQRVRPQRRRFNRNISDVPVPDALPTKPSAKRRRTPDGTGQPDLGGRGDRRPLRPEPAVIDPVDLNPDEESEDQGYTEQELW